MSTLSSLKWTQRFARGRVHVRQVMARIVRHGTASVSGSCGSSWTFGWSLSQGAAKFCKCIESWILCGNFTHPASDVKKYPWWVRFDFINARRSHNLPICDLLQTLCNKRQNHNILPPTKKVHSSECLPAQLIVNQVTWRAPNSSATLSAYIPPPTFCINSWYAPHLGEVPFFSS